MYFWLIYNYFLFSSDIQEDIVWLGAIKKKNKYFWLSCSNKTDGINLGSKNNSQGDHVYLKRGASRWQSTFGSFFYIPFICEGKERNS